ncbi:MAG: helix-turn-helix domain-containing protein, partial [Spirochaetaceae bacterium]|nr:helix-turn-helix domain-containing protein [Spirochaetaceae bacterium]
MEKCNTKKKYKQLSFSEREEIAIGLEQGKSR